METGGYLSHGSIVAREYGLPAVVNIPGLLRQVSSGERVTVDGDEGTVARAASYTAGAISTSASSPG
jgi:pyruvate,water dikinase